MAKMHLEYYTHDCGAFDHERGVVLSGSPCTPSCKNSTWNSNVVMTDVPEVSMSTSGTDDNICVMYGDEIIEDQPQDCMTGCRVTYLSIEGHVYVDRRDEWHEKMQA